MRLLNFVCLLISVSVLLAIPGQINYQGKLTDADGVAINGTHNFVFGLYSTSTGGTALWQEAHASVSVQKGLFDVVLGETNPLPDALDFSAQYWLQITVDAEDLSPRIPLSSVPYAFRASIADSAANIDLDTLQAYSDTNHTHNLTLTGDITGSGTVSGTIATDLANNSVDWNELATPVQDSIVGNWVRLSPNTAQTDAGATPSIYINKTGVGELLLLQNSGTDRVKISNSGNDFSLIGPGGTKSIVSDSALTISANRGITMTIDADDNSGSSSLRILHDTGDTLFWISEANYIGIKPRTTEPSSSPRGGLYVNGNVTGTDTIYFYDGNDWEPMMTATMTSGNFILNRYSSEQIANFLIAGKGNVHNTADNDTAFIAREGGADGIGGYFRGGSSAGAVALIAERPTENNRAELGTADYGVYGEVNGSDESAVMGHNIASSGTDSAKGVIGVADGAGGTIHIGVQGNSSGATTNYGGFFSPIIGLAPQSSIPAGANGGLYVKDASPDSLYFYDGSGWTSIVTGAGNTQWEQTGTSPNRYKRPLFDGAGNDNVRIFETGALKGVYGRTYQDASNYALGYLGYYGNDIGGINRFIGIYGNSGVGANNVAVGGRYDANNYGYIGGNDRGVAGFGSSYGVYGESAVEGVRGVATGTIGGERGIFGYATGTGGSNIGVYGFNDATGPGDKVGVFGNAAGLAATGTRYGVQGLASGATTNYGIYGDIGGNPGYGVYGNAGAGQPYGYIGNSNYAVYGEYNPTTYGFIGGQVSGDDIAIRGNGTWSSGFFGDYNDSDCGERGIYAIGTIYGIFARDTTGGTTSADNFAYLGYREPTAPNTEYGIFASGLDYAGYFLGNVEIGGSTGNDARQYINRPSISEEASIRFQTAGSDDWFLGLDDPVSGYNNFQLYNYDAGSYVVTVENSTGNVGIGTTSPSNGKLVVSYSSTDIYGIYVSTPGYAIYGNAFGGGGGRGIIGAGGEIGVFGSYGDYTSSDTWGKLGFYDGTNYYGAYGYSYDSHSSNTNFGVRGRAGDNSNRNVGVFGDVGSMLVGAKNYGVWGDACGPDSAFGVYGCGHDADVGIGVYGSGCTYAVYGKYDAGTYGYLGGSSYGVYGRSSNTAGDAGVYAYNGGSGVWSALAYYSGSAFYAGYFNGDVHITGKLTAIGGVDPPYVLYDSETREAIKARIVKEVPKEKLTGAVLFWNGESKRFEVYLPTEGEFLDLQGNLLLKEEPLQLK
ncbi:hypothetical protein J7L68_05245 [bacterium]|nr:hypothetical protein [bacterium]